MVHDGARAIPGFPEKLESELKQRYPQATWVNADTGSVAMVMVK